MKNFIFIVACGYLLTGCASITTGKNQSLSVTTTPELQASCELTNDKGVWYIPMTPGTTTVNRSYSDLTVICKKGNKHGTVKVKSATKGMMAGNILFGGIVGAAVDAGTGAGYDYPSLISVPLQ